MPVSQLLKGSFSAVSPPIAVTPSIFQLLRVALADCFVPSSFSSFQYLRLLFPRSFPILEILESLFRYLPSCSLFRSLNFFLKIMRHRRRREFESARRGPQCSVESMTLTCFKNACGSFFDMAPKYRLSQPSLGRPQGQIPVFPSRPCVLP